MTISFSAGAPPVVTGAGGTFSVALPAGLGEVTVTPSRPGYRFVPTSRRVVVCDGDVAADFRASREAPGARAALPDLLGYLFQAPASALWGSVIVVRSQVRNQGNAPATVFPVQWYLSRDATGSADDLALRRLGSTSTSYNHPGIVSNAYGSAFNISLVLPSARPTGWSGTQFHIVMRTDSAGQVAEANEANNFGEVGSGRDQDGIVVGVLPDLKGLFLSSSTTAFWGQTLSIRAHVGNTGAAPSDSFRVQWYLSKDAAGSVDDLPLTLGAGTALFVHCDGLAANEVKDISVSARLPATPREGWESRPAYIVMKTDSAREVAEGDENNNFGQAGNARDVVPVYLFRADDLPDLQGAGISGPSIARWGDAVEIEGHVRNNGTASGPSRVQWYLSKDRIGSPDDVLLPLVGSSVPYRTVAGIGVRGVVEANATLRLPTAPPDGFATIGSFFIIQKTDSDNQVVESDEGNNFGTSDSGDRASLRILPIGALPDLQGERCWTPLRARWGDSIFVDAGIRNAGGDAGASRIQWYLSRDNVASPDDIPLRLGHGQAHYTCPPIAPLASVGVTTALLLPPTRPEGWSGTLFRVIMRTDAANQVSESNERNNFGQMGLDRDQAGIIVELLDLRGSVCRATASTAQWGGTVTLLAGCNKNGSYETVPFRVQWFLSRDAVGSTDDLPLSLADGQGSYWSVPGTRDRSDWVTFVLLQLPETPPEGWTGTDFHIIMKTDALNQVTEANEGNNFGSVGEGRDRTAIRILSP